MNYTKRTKNALTPLNFATVVVYIPEFDAKSRRRCVQIDYLEYDAKDGKRTQTT